MKHILITGGAGFIGAHLTRTLLAQGHNVTVVDNFSTGSRAAIEGSGAAIIEHDILEPLDVKADRIYNLACPASPVHYQRDPVQTTLINVLGAYHMLELAKRNNARILQASTSEVYGDPQLHPQPESYVGHVNPIGPRACYDEGKRCAETMFFDYHRQHGLDIKVARIFNTYGPGMNADDGRVVSNFIQQALRAQPLTMYGDGTQTRSFCYVDDMVNGLIALMESEPGITGPVNLGNPEEYTMEELAELILELTGSDSALAYKPLPQDDPLQRRPDISLAKNVLGWEPKISVRKGLEKTIAHVRQQSGKAGSDAGIAHNV